jgi:hypothetical protein
VQKLAFPNFASKSVFAVDVLAITIARNNSELHALSRLPTLADQVAFDRQLGASQSRLRIFTEQ